MAELSGTVTVTRPERQDPDTGKTVTVDADDAFVINMKFANGALGSFAYTSASPVALGARIVIDGSDGLLMLPQPGVNPTSDDVVHGAKAGEELAPLPRPEAFEPLPDDSDRRIPSFRLLLRDFDRSIREGKSYGPSFDDGVKVQAILDAVRESSATGKAVKLG